MPLKANIIPCADSASKSENYQWEPIGDVAKALLEKSVGAINAGHFEVAETYHAQAVEIEAGPQGGDL